MKLTDEYIFNQPEKYKSILLYLIDVVHQTIPNASLIFKWGIPYFYYKNKTFCYLAPNHKKGFVDLGFARGFQLESNQEILVSKNRNTVKSLRYFNFDSIEQDVLISVLLEAITLYK